jgi:hypothetical protein
LAHTAGGGWGTGPHHLLKLANEELAHLNEVFTMSKIRGTIFAAVTLSAMTAGAFMSMGVTAAQACNDGTFSQTNSGWGARQTPSYRYAGQHCHWPATHRHWHTAPQRTLRVHVHHQPQQHTHKWVEHVQRETTHRHH